MYNKRGGGIRGGFYSLVASGMDKDIVEHPDFARVGRCSQSLWYGQRQAADKGED